VFLDLNLNGQLDSNEPTAITNSAGVYSFPNLATGRYFIFPVLPAGWRADGVYSRRGDSVGRTVTDLDFGVTQTARIAGKAFLDSNKNGVLDRYESPLLGWTVYLDANNNGKLDAGEQSATITAGASYAFDALAPGTYVVRIVQQAGYKPTTVGMYRLTLTAGQDSHVNNFGQVGG
jgi:hypothetical protein